MLSRRHCTEAIGFKLSEIQGFIHEFEDATSGREATDRARSVFREKLDEMGLEFEMDLSHHGITHENVGALIEEYLEARGVEEAEPAASEEEVTDEA